MYFSLYCIWLCKCHRYDGGIMVSFYFEILSFLCAQIVQEEIEREVGVNKGVSDKWIRLKMFSPNVLNITLVQLPGINKVPVGDLPSDIEAQIRTMIFSYIKHETCFILVVSPTNAYCQILMRSRWQELLILMVSTLVYNCSSYNFERPR